MPKYIRYFTQVSIYKKPISLVDLEIVNIDELDDPKIIKIGKISTEIGLTFTKIGDSKNIKTEGSLECS